jgi:hypothetical protein
VYEAPENDRDDHPGNPSTPDGVEMGEEDIA